MVVLRLRSFIRSDLPEELVLDIFCRLPDKELLGLRCVSKQYYDLISKILCPRLAALAPISGFFYKCYAHIIKRDTTLHTTKRIKSRIYNYVNPTGIYTPSSVEFFESYMSLLPCNPKKTYLLGCFNGFFLVSDSDSSVASHQYFICNPATRQLVFIPASSNEYQKERDCFVGLAFDPLLATQEQHHHFKFVRISINRERKIFPFFIHVFSSATSKWHSFPIDFKPEALGTVLRAIRCMVYANGVFYMLSLARYLICIDLHLLDDDSTKYSNTNSPFKARAIKLPHTLYNTYYPLGLFEVSNGSLYYACTTLSELLVWTFQVDKACSPWNLKYDIRLSDFRPHPVKKIIAVDLSAEIIYASGVNSMCSYNIKNKQHSGQQKLKTGAANYSLSRIYAYSCCLLTLFDDFSQREHVLIS